MFEFQAEAAEAGLQGRFALGIPLQSEVRGSTQRLGHQETEGMASSGGLPARKGPQGSLWHCGIGTETTVAASAEPGRLKAPGGLGRFPTQLQMSPAILSPRASPWPPLPPPHSQNLAGERPRPHPLTVGSAPQAREFWELWFLPIPVPRTPQGLD